MLEPTATQLVHPRVILRGGCLVLFVSVAGCAGAARPSEAPGAAEVDVASSSAERDVVVHSAIERARATSAESSSECGIAWHGPMGRSVLVIPEDVAVEAFEPARVALCGCREHLPPDSHVTLRFDFGAGEVTASATEPALDHCLGAHLHPGRFRPHPELPASDVVDPTAPRPSSGPIVVLPVRL